MITLMRVNESLNSKSSRINEEAQWKTMRGARILVEDDSKIIAGPDPSKLNKNKKGEGSSKKTSSKKTSSKKNSSSNKNSSKEPKVRSAYQRFDKDECKAALSKVKEIGKADAENIATVLANAGPNQEPVFDTSNITGQRNAPPSMRSADDVAAMIGNIIDDGFEFQANASGKRKDNNSVTLYFKNKKTNKLVTAELYNSTN